MIKYVVGDLIDAAKSREVDVIAHCCNCYCTFGSGIAPLIKNAFPEAYAADVETIKGDLSKIGSYSLGWNMDSEEGALAIFNLYGQGGYHRRLVGLRDLNYDALYDALDLMNTYLKQWDGQLVIGLPLLGAGLAGGKWSIIEAMIEETLGKSDNMVIVYVLDEALIPEGALRG